jgi:acetyl-CoA synthetase
MNVSGHRLSTAEIESALVWHPKVAEAAVVGAADGTTGQAVVGFVILRESAGDGGQDVVRELRAHVGKEIGPIAKPGPPNGGWPRVSRDVGVPRVKAPAGPPGAA